MIGSFINIINSIASIITIVEFFKILGGKLLGTKKSFSKKKPINGKVCGCELDNTAQRYYLIILTSAIIKRL